MPNLREAWIDDGLAVARSALPRSLIRLHSPVSKLAKQIAGLLYEF